MSQFARPASDLSVGAWATAPLWSKLNEVSPDDAINVNASVPSLSSGSFSVSLSAVNDPSSSLGHVIRVRTISDDSFGGAASFTFELFQGAALIASFNSTATFASGLFVTDTRTLSGVEADSITDYSGLSIKVTATDQNGNGTSCTVSWMEFEVPSIPRPAPFYDVFLWARPDE